MGAEFQILSVADQLPARERMTPDELLRAAAIVDSSVSFTIEYYPVDGKHGAEDRFNFRLDLERVNTEPVTFMQRHFQARKRNGTTSNGLPSERWYARGDDAYAVIESVGQLLRVKAFNADLAFAFREAQSQGASASELQAYRARMRAWNQHRTYIDRGPLEKPYVGTYFDQHGHIGIARNGDGALYLRAGLALDNHPFMKGLLQQYDKYNAEKDDGSARLVFTLTSNEAAAFLRAHVPYMHTQRRLAMLGILFQQDRKRSLPTVERHERRLFEQAICEEFAAEATKVRPRKKPILASENNIM